MEWTEATPGARALQPGEVHVWRFQLDPALEQPPLRGILSAYLGVDPDDVALTKGPHGKPALASSTHDIHFNVSHSGKWGLIAIAPTAVGVDVEQVRARRASARLADRFLTAGERDLLQSRVESHGDAAFFMIWSRKEAYLKAVGVGLSLPFGNVDSSEERLPDLDAQGRQQPGSEPWVVREFFVDDLHPAAVVARASQITLSCLTLGRFAA